MNALDGIRSVPLWRYVTTARQVLCIEHALERTVEVTTHALLNRIVTLPQKARQFLCRCCKQALEQPRRVA